MKALARQLTEAARVLRSSFRVTEPAVVNGNVTVTIYVTKGESIWILKEKP